MQELERKIEYSFKDQSLLKLALAHPSLANLEHLSNQRLEFLGDAVLQLCVSTHLYKELETSQEGQLSRRRAALVQEQALLKAALSIDLGKYLQLGPGEELTGGRDKPSILADALEALLGAVYLDGGLQEADTIVQKLILSLPPVPETRDYKTDYQELIQRVSGVTPVYEITNESGPPHDRTFTAQVKVNEKVTGEGSGPSKKAAEQAAAQGALEKGS